MTCTAPPFSTLALAPNVLANLNQLGYLAMTPIQAATLPLALQGNDVIAQAKTGSGKTAAFGIALLANLNARRFAVQTLVLCPTRELADQVSTEIRRLARYQDNVKVVTLCGGVALRGQTASLAHGAHIVVGTPGRVMDHLARGHLTLEALNTLVLDEADRMLDMGFFDDIVTVTRQCPTERQTLLFSATYPEGIAQLGQQFMRQPHTIGVDAGHTHTHITQRFIEVTRATRLATMLAVLHHYRPVSTLAFCNTKAQCKEAMVALHAKGISALALHGELEQRERDQVLVQFANRSCSVLVATDVAARGLDIHQLELVLNVDTPPDPETYTHRIGRTGRAEQEGLAMTLVSMDEMGYVGRVEALQSQPSEWLTTTDLTARHTTPLLAPMVTLHIVGGRKEKIRAGDVLGALTAQGACTREQVGKITVNEFSSYVAVERSVAQHALAALEAGRVKGRMVKVRRL